MDTMKEGMEAAAATRVPKLSARRVRAADIMTRRVLTLRDDQPIVTAVMKLVGRKVSGAPVLDEEGDLVGVLSEFDCMKLLANGSFHQEGVPRNTLVRDLMSKPRYKIQPETDLFAIASLFIAHGIRRLPVLDGSKLVGIVSRRDALNAISRLYR